MTTYLGKNVGMCSFCLPRVPFVNCRQFMYYFPFGSEGRIWDLIVSVPDHCFFFTFHLTVLVHLIQIFTNRELIPCSNENAIFPMEFDSRNTLGILALVPKHEGGRCARPD